MTHSPLVPKMVGPSSSSPPSSFITPPHYPSMKLRNLLVQTYILSQVYVNKAKALLLRLFKDLLHFRPWKWKTTSSSSCTTSNNNKLIFGSFRLYYNWCSTAIPNSVHHASSCCTTWNTCSNTTFHHYNFNTNFELHDCSADDLSRYLQWLEDNKTPTPAPAPGECNNNNCIDHEQEVNEIDRLADLFIANCHEKFRLEKQESYRMFQEMMARSV